MVSLVSYHGSAQLFEQFLCQEEADALYTALLAQIAWREEVLSIYGRQVTVPRLVAWYGDPQLRYSYSGVCHEALPWLPELMVLKRGIESHCGGRFNGVLANLYRHGGDSMGWHADDEPELGSNPVIASLSLGQARRFKLRHKRTKEVVNVELGHGDLLLMAGELQHHWQHCVPKSRRAMGPRINLTFRRIYSSNSASSGSTVSPD